MWWRNSVSFHLWLKKYENEVKISLLSNERNFFFQNWKQLHFSEENYLNFTKKTQFCGWQLHFFRKQRQTRETVENSWPISLNLIKGHFQIQVCPSQFWAKVLRIAQPENYSYLPPCIPWTFWGLFLLFFSVLYFSWSHLQIEDI